MNEQRNRARTALHEALGGSLGDHNSLTMNALRPLLDPSKGRPFSKGISKGPSIGGSAARYRAARGGLLDGYLMQGDARGGSNAAKPWFDRQFAHSGLIAVYLMGRRFAP